MSHPRTDRFRIMTSTVTAAMPTSYSRVTLSRIMTAVDVNRLRDACTVVVPVKFVDDEVGGSPRRSQRRDRGAPRDRRDRLAGAPMRVG